MRWAIFENIMTPGGHEVEFDRMLVLELQKAGQEVSFCVPEDFSFAVDYQVSVHRLSGQTITYTGAKGLTKIVRSVKREWYRQKWYKELLDLAEKRLVDVIIVPTASFRYVRALVNNPLKKTPIPLIFLLHGMRPQDAPKFFAAAEKLLPYANVRLAVLNFTDDVLGKKLPNVHTVLPPTYLPRDISWSPEREGRARLQEFAAGRGGVLKLGFLGQYRREKRLEDFMSIFAAARYARDVKLIVQGSTIDPRDKESFAEIMRTYANDKRIEFWPYSLKGAQWQQAIADMDAILMPYSAPRYRYQCSGMLFTALGSEKPVVTSDDLNPEVFQKYKVGATFKSGDMQELARCVEDFVNTFDAKAALYSRELSRAAQDFAPENLVGQLLELANLKNAD